MSRHFLVILLVLLGFLPARKSSAQLSAWWSPVDTITQGDFDEIHPTTLHNSQAFSGPGDRLWIVFERHSALRSDIVARRYLVGSQMWDSTDFVISSAPADSAQSYPDIGTGEFYGVSRFNVAAWQRWDGAHWQIWYSSLGDTSAGWTPPRQLTNDPVNNTGVQIRGFNDSTVWFTWKRDSAIVTTRIGPSSVTPVETLGIVSPSQFDFDVANLFGRLEVLWTNGPDQVVIRSKTLNVDLTWSVPESLSVSPPMMRPRLYVGPIQIGSFLFESTLGNTRDVFLLGDSFGSNDYHLIDDSTSDDFNASAYRSPVVTKRAAISSQSNPHFDAFVYERVAPGDSALVFANFVASDTVRSRGHNQNPVLSSDQVYENGMKVLTVWESNRTGRSHIYARWTNIYIWDVKPPTETPAAISLDQNYPNPFNPTTTIQYTVAGIRSQVSGVSEVRLVIYDVLGREVATLVNGRQAPGRYSVKFDGSLLASGVYFYHLSAGSFISVRKMTLMK